MTHAISEPFGQVRSHRRLFLFLGMTRDIQLPRAIIFEMPNRLPAKIHVLLALYLAFTCYALAGPHLNQMTAVPSGNVSTVDAIIPHCKVPLGLALPPTYHSPIQVSSLVLNNYLTLLITRTARTHFATWSNSPASKISIASVGILDEALRYREDGALEVASLCLAARMITTPMSLAIRMC